MHVDPELLALLALGERVGTADDRSHVETCSVCAAELAELQEVVALARGGADLTLVEPSSRVWTAIQDDLVGRRPEPTGPPREWAARARLSPTGPDWSQVSGDAEVRTDEHGRRLLTVTLHAELPSVGVRQAWLVHRDDPGRRQTVGILDGRHGLWTVEHAVDLEQFSVVDISQQGIASTEHSGQSIVRGELVAVP